MKKVIVAVITILLVFNLAGMAGAGEKAPQKVIDLAGSKLVKLGEDPVIVNAVKEENAKGKTLAQIQEMDAKWQNTPGIADFMEGLMNSECGKHLRSIQEAEDYFSEIFVMDNQGANVAMTDKTSDYWQGDEAKFKESYNGGKGGVHISDIEFDDSTQAYLVQVSIPVKDSGTVIGAITVGVDVDKIE